MNERIVPVAYCLKLPVGARIHEVFHVSLLKPFVEGSSTASEGELPDILGTRPILRPIQILDRWVALHGDQAVDQVLVEWAGSSQNQPTWEPVSTVRRHFPHLLEDKEPLNRGELI